MKKRRSTETTKTNNPYIYSYDKKKENCFETFVPFISIKGKRKTKSTANVAVFAPERTVDAA